MENKPTVAEKHKAQWESLAFTGDAPFDDGATPEVLARNALREQQFNQKQTREKEKSWFQRREEQVANTPMLQIARKLSKVQFNNPLADCELQRCRKLALSRTKGERKDVQLMLYRYLRTQFVHFGGPYISSTRPIRESDSTFRIADLIRGEMWEYRRAGQNGEVLNDSQLNISLDRMHIDQMNEPEVYSLVKEYCAELLKLTDGDGYPIFSKTPREHVGRGAVNNNRGIKISTLLRRMDELEKRFETQAQLLILETKRNGELADRLTTLRATQDANAAELRSRLINLLGINTRLMGRVEELEKARLNTSIGMIHCAEAAKNIQEVVVPSGPLVR